MPLDLGGWLPLLILLAGVAGLSSQGGRARLGGADLGFRVGGASVVLQVADARGGFCDNERKTRRTRGGGGGVEFLVSPLLRPCPSSRGGQGSSLTLGASPRLSSACGSGELRCAFGAFSQVRLRFAPPPWGESVVSARELRPRASFTT
jgi:hypothetical protein